MEVEEIQTQAPPSKFPRIDLDSLKVGQNYPPEEEDDLKLARMTSTGAAADNGTSRLRSWHHSSRIIRVSRASGGKDRHSKVLTSKGLRDRRVRLSVSTAIQFYDIQDRLGYDQPSKAVEWLIKAASEAIAELPSLNNFPHTPTQLSDEKRASEGTEHGFDSANVEIEDNPDYQNQNQQQQHVSLSKSACSSTSETSKGSGLSLSRSEIRVNRVKKSRERARERAAKDKEKDPPPAQAHQGGHGAAAPLATPISQTSSFTELLTAGITSNSNSSPSGSAHQPNPAGRQWASSSPMDYFSAGQFLSRGQNLPGFLGQIQLPQALPVQVPPFSISGEGNNGNGNSNHHQELQHISFVNAEHLNLIPVTSSAGGEYNLNFTISPSSVSSSSSSPGLIAGFNRGTLQSNLPHLQRFTSSPHHHVDGSTNNLPFFIGAAAVPSPVETSHHHHNHQHHQHQQLHIGHFSSGIESRLQLCYGDGNRQGNDHKGKAAKS
ncbi:transcription factor TCP2-like [Punica granatum]|uniref:TCP domain-containing protein n=2 Tax=Punica granatum TaxID=22663 RepID=A0A218VUV6_PUNGR|nr:transcription factor TCP2-like [Punica granatum]XP_031403700.1 transcription factor TCP2-like [Punica granatum]OWM63860.1 hypothetical protein CDL15_Pgr006122 [Punica granatum]PKI68038.1 hypothetical protein CRG98_011634 [Punica granatum]